jgi:hypothetical protein
VREERTADGLTRPRPGDRKRSPGREELDRAASAKHPSQTALLA